jgi:hypothetical protein
VFFLGRLLVFFPAVLLRLRLRLSRASSASATARPAFLGIVATFRILS